MLPRGRIAVASTLRKRPLSWMLTAKITLRGFCFLATYGSLTELSWTFWLLKNELCSFAL